MSKKHTLTLSHWHKVAERLSREFTETIFKTKRVFNHTSVDSYLGESQARDLQERKELYKTRFERALRIQDSIAIIRAALGEANARVGITARLAEYDKLNRRQKALAEIVEGDSGDMVEIGSLHTTPRNYVSRSDDLFSSRGSSIRVRMLDRDEMMQFRDLLDRVRGSAYALSDEIAESNKATLSLELPDEVAVAAGLKSESGA
jgi:hypothetical protein